LTIIEKKEYYDIVYDILKNEEFQKRKNYKHHYEISVYDHSLAVSKLSYVIAKRMNLDYKSAAIGGLLHDFYSKPWQDNYTKHKFLESHGFVHAEDALLNAHKYFPDLMNEKIDNIIIRHMFPLNKIPPKYKESWIITIADKYVSLETFKNPSFILRLIGIRKKSDINE
jgi:uncharacterized protein